MSERLGPQNSSLFTLTYLRHQVVNRPGRHALDIGLLHQCGERLLGHASRFKENRENMRLCAIWGCAVRRCRRLSPRSGRGSHCAEPDDPGASLGTSPLSAPRPRAPSAVGLQKSRSSRATNLHPGSAPGAPAGSVGHPVVPRIRLVSQPAPTGRTIDGRPRGRSLATALLPVRFASGFRYVQLHYLLGHDPPRAAG
jgi:hypothetical protein